MRIDVKPFIKEVMKGLDELQREVVPRAAQQALNRVAPTVKTATVRKLQAELRLKNQAGLRASIKIVKAQKGNLEAVVTTQDRSISIDETRNALVRVTRKRITRADGRRGGYRKVTTVLFKGAKLDGVIQVELSPRSIRKKDGGRYTGGKRSQRVAPVFAYTVLQELIRAEIDKGQEMLGIERFDIEFNRALAEGLRRLRL